MKHGADVNATREYGVPSPLSEAVWQGWLEGVQFLLERGAKANYSFWDSGTSEGMVMFGLQGKDNFLQRIITNKSEEMMKLLLKHVIVTPMTSLSMQGIPELALRSLLSFDAIELLLAKVPDLDKDPGWEDALIVVLECSTQAKIGYCRGIHRKLISLSPYLGQRAVQRAWDHLPVRHKNPYHYERFLETDIDFLMEAGATIDSCAEDGGSTILQRAAHYGYENLCFYLISRGAAINVSASKRYGTPLQGAIREGCVDLINTLLEKGADVNAPPAEYKGVTALQAASIKGMMGLVIRLLERGADVSAAAAPEDGRTAIDGAAERGRFDMVHLLLIAHGRNANLKLVRLQAAGYAEKEGHYELSKLLRGKLV